MSPLLGAILVILIICIGAYLTSRSQNTSTNNSTNTNTNNNSTNTNNNSTNTNTNTPIIPDSIPFIPEETEDGTVYERPVTKPAPEYVEITTR